MSVKYNLELCFRLFPPFFCNWFIFLLGNCVTNSIIAALTLCSATIGAVCEIFWWWWGWSLLLEINSGESASTKVACHLLV